MAVAMVGLVPTSLMLVVDVRTGATLPVLSRSEMLNLRLLNGFPPSALTLPVSLGLAQSSLERHRAPQSASEFTR